MSIASALQAYRNLIRSNGHSGTHECLEGVAARSRGIDSAVERKSEYICTAVVRG